MGVFDYSELKNVCPESLTELGFKEIHTKRGYLYIKHTEPDIQITYYPRDTWYDGKYAFREGIGFLNCSAMNVDVRGKFWVSNDYKIRCKGKIEFVELLLPILNKSSKDIFDNE